MSALDTITKFVGIDLSYSSTGVVVLDKADESLVACHVLKAGKPEYPFHERALDLWRGLKRVLPEPKSTTICIEGAAYAAEFNAFILGELSGAIKCYLHDNGYRYTIIPPPSLKKFATGAGNAQKHYVAANVAKNWGFTHPSNDVVDAFVLAKMAEAGPDAIPESKPKNKSKKKEVD